MLNRKFITAGIAALLLALAAPAPAYAATPATKLTAEEEEALKAAEEAKKAAKKEAKKHKHEITALEILGAGSWKNKNFKSNQLDYSVNLEYTEREVYIRAKMYNTSCTAKIDGYTVTPDENGWIGLWERLPIGSEALPNVIDIEISSSSGSKTYHISFVRDGWAGLTDVGYTSDVPVNEQVLDLLSCEDMLRTIVETKDVQKKMPLAVYDAALKYVLTEGSGIGFASYSARSGAQEGTFGNPVQFYFTREDNETDPTAPASAYGRVAFTEDQLAWFSHAYFGDNTMYEEIISWDDTIYGRNILGQQYYFINMVDEEKYGKVWFDLSKYSTSSNGKLTIKGYIYGKGEDGKKIKLGAVTFYFSEYIAKGEYSDLPISYGKRLSFDSYTFRETSTVNAKEFREAAGIN